MTARPARATVFLLGGDSGTGKTTVARAIARRTDRVHLRLDDLWVISRRIVAAAERPALHAFTDPHAALRRPIEEVHRQERAVSETLAPAIETLVAIYLRRDEPVIVEGALLAPALASRPAFDGVGAEGRVRAAFLVEHDAEELLKAIRERGDFAHYGGYDERELALHARLATLYSEWIAGEARRHGLPLVPARPRHDVVERTLAALTR